MKTGRRQHTVRKIAVPDNCFGKIPVSQVSTVKADAIQLFLGKITVSQVGIAPVAAIYGYGRHIYLAESCAGCLALCKGGTEHTAEFKSAVQQPAFAEICHRKFTGNKFTSVKGNAGQIAFRKIHPYKSQVFQRIADQ